MDIAQILANRQSMEIISCPPTMIVKDVVSLLAEKRIGAIPVMDNDKIVGIFSERDVICRIAVDVDACLNCAVEEIMTKEPVTVSPAANVMEALGLMTRRRIRHLPVVDNGAMIGFISIGDLVKSRIDEIQQEADSLREYIQTA